MRHIGPPLGQTIHLLVSTQSHIKSHKLKLKYTYTQKKVMLYRLMNLIIMAVWWWCWWLVCILPAKETKAKWGR